MPPATRRFEKILAAGNRAAKITNGVLGMARNRSESFEPTDLAKLIDDTLVLLEREMSKYRIRSSQYLRECRRRWPTAIRFSRCC